MSEILHGKKSLYSAHKVIQILHERILIEAALFIHPYYLPCFSFVCCLVLVRRYSAWRVSFSFILHSVFRETR